MYWRTIVLALSLVALPLVHAEETEAKCDKEGLHNTVTRLRTLVQKWKSSDEGKTLLLSDLGNNIEEVSNKFEELMKSCSPEDSLQFSGVILFVTGMVADEPVFAINAVRLMQDDHLREDVLSLVCAVDCVYVLNFVKSIEETEYQMQMYQHLMNLMKNTQLNNTELVTSTDYVKQLNTLVSEENSTTLSEMLHRLLRQAIRTDMVLQHDNLEELYKVNHDVTAAVVYELVTEYINTPIETEDELEDFPLFEMIKCTTGKALWLQHLELVVKKLKESNKVSSLYTLILLKQLNTLEELVDDDLKQKVQQLKNELPTMAQKVLSGKACLEVTDKLSENRIFFASEDGQPKVMKFIPKEDGSLTAVSGKLREHFITVFVKEFDESQNVFQNYEVSMERGELKTLKIEEYCNDASLNVCLPFNNVVPPINLLSTDFGLTRTMARFVIHSSRCEAIESS